MDAEVDSTSWDLLDNALILQIITPLSKAKDKASLDALMQTSRAVRALAASSIPSATLIVDHPQCMNRFPAHATIRAMRIKMEPEEAIKFLNTMASEVGAHRRLKMVERVIFMRSSMSEQGDSEQNTKDLVAALGAALPRLRHLVGIDVHHLDVEPEQAYPWAGDPWSSAVRQHRLCYKYLHQWPWLGSQAPVLGLGHLPGSRNVTVWSEFADLGRTDVSDIHSCSSVCCA